MRDFGKMPIAIGILLIIFIDFDFFVDAYGRCVIPFYVVRNTCAPFAR